VFHLIGGPGGSAEAFLPVLKDFAALARTARRDVVLVDQRGTGHSKPFLDCDEEFAAAQASGGNPRSACVARLNAQGIDPADFTPAAIVDDIDDVRRALAYGRIDVWGQSAGSYLAQEYARRHPDSVRSLFLESVDTGPSSLARPSGFNAALDRMFTACARERRCATRNPELDRRLSQTVARLANRPLRTAAGPLDGAAFIAMVEQSLEFAAGTVVTADLITAAHRRDATTVNAVLAQLSAGPEISGPFSVVMNELVNCAQVQSYASAESVEAANVGIRPELRAVTVPPVLGQYVTNCSQWDVTFPADAAGVPQPTTVPTLVINGDVDPNTALDGARTVASYARTVQTVAFAGYGHLIAVRGDACGLAVYASFLHAPGEPVNQNCVPTTIRFGKPTA
jgi:pimeloyl-ACP methyl ester carboxylesterase